MNPQTPLVMLGAGAVVLWVMLSVSGYRHETPAAHQQSGLLVRAIPPLAAQLPVR